MRELRCAGWREDTQQGTPATGVARDCGDVGSVAGWPSGREWNGLQPGQGATELGFPRPAAGEMQSEAARRAGDPSHQSEDPPPEGLGDHGPLAQTNPRRPAGQMRHHLDRQPGAVGGEAPRRHVVQPDAVLEVAYGVLDLGVAAMIGLQFQRLPIAVGDEGVIAVGEEGLSASRRTMSRAGGASGLVWNEVVSATGGAVHPVGNGSPVLLCGQVPQASALGDREAGHPFPGRRQRQCGRRSYREGPHRSAPAPPSHAGSGAAPRAVPGPGSSGPAPRQWPAGVIAAGAGIRGGDHRSRRWSSQVDGQGRVAGSGPSGPGPGQQLAAHAVELTDMPPPEAAQERPQGGWRLDHAA